MRFLHVMLRVKDIEKSLNFYQNLFDMNLVNTIDLEDEFKNVSNKLFSKKLYY